MSENSAETVSQTLHLEGVWTGSFFDMNSSSLTDVFLELQAFSESEYIGALEISESDGTIYQDEIEVVLIENKISFQDDLGRYYLLEYANGELAGGRSPDCFECESEGIFTLHMDNAGAGPTGTWVGTYTSIDDGLEEIIVIDFFPLEDEPNSYLGSFTHFLAEGGTTYLSLGGHLDGNMLTFQDENNLYYQATLEGETISGNVSAECFGCLPEEAIFTLSKE
ncbi:MAG: hypothetical protein GY755_22000, partial [Chloroflexi bacterium]|nr:hypothetical protein [Chloroflexota bacterium]